LTSFVRSVLKKITEFFQNVEKKKLIMLITLAAVVVIAGIIGAILLNQVHYTVLYSGLDASEAGTIKELLDEKGVNSKVRGTSTILVPEDQADTLRIELASQGYPRTGLNYEIFSAASSIGSTDLERRTYQQFQLQENIRTTIRHMEKVKDCIVIANLASDSSFVVSDNRTEASVAVSLILKDGQTLTKSEAKTIQMLVLKCIPNLKPENISIVDSKLNYYDINGDTEADSTEYTVTQQQLTEQLKDVLSKQVLRVLEPAVGKGNVAVAVNLSLNFDKQTVDKVEFSPPVEGELTGLPRSSEETYSGSRTTDGAGGVTGTNPNGTGTPAYVAETEEPDGVTESSYTKIYNYELNEIRTKIEKAQGTPQNLSVAVLINANVEDAAGYANSYKNLAAKAIGVKPDYISVEIMPFVDQKGGEDSFQQYQKTLQQLSRDKLLRTIVTAVIVLAAVLVIARFFLKKPSRVPLPENAAAVAAGAGADGYIVGMTSGDFIEGETEEELDLADLVLKKSSEAEKIEELMERYPETVVQILRSWLAEDN